MTKDNHVLTMGDVARICNVSPRTAIKWFDRGILSGYRLPGSNDRRVPIEEFLYFIKVNNMPSSYTTKIQALKIKK
ncbi:MAG: helix-turn-helix domain-containing protein [Planctomycetota bacterium]|jgi:hypothetical protein